MKKKYKTYIKKYVKFENMKKNIYKIRKNFMLNL
jgi:hypothetical protein